MTNKSLNKLVDEMRKEIAEKTGLNTELGVKGGDREEVTAYLAGAIRKYRDEIVAHAVKAVQG